MDQFFNMEKSVFETQELLREIQENENRRNELLKDILVSNALVALDYNDVKSILSCDGRMVINKVEADTFQSALERFIIDPEIENDVILDAKKLLLSISIKNNDHLLLEEMGYVQDFLQQFKNCSEAKWGLSINAMQTQGVCVTLWAVGL